MYNLKGRCFCYMQLRLLFHRSHQLLLTPIQKIKDIYVHSLRYILFILIIYIPLTNQKKDIDDAER